MIKFIVEAYSEESYEDAMVQALGKASAHMARDNDVHIDLVDMSYDEETGYHIALEVTVVPMGDKDSFKIKRDEELNKRMAVEIFRKLRTNEGERLKNMISDHFRRRGHCPDIPALNQSWINETHIANDIVERQFLHAVHDVEIPTSSPNVPDIHKILGRPTFDLG